MELFSFAGVSNAEILMAAGVVLVGAAAISTIARSMGGGARAKLAARVDRLEVRLAAAQTYQPALQIADEVLKRVSNGTETAVIELFEATSSRRSWFEKAVEPHEIATNLVSDLRDNIEQATAIARPIHNMIDNGSIEVAPERARLAADAKERAACLGSETWERHGAKLLEAGLPSQKGAALIDCFTRANALKASVNALGRKPSAEQLIDVLRQTAELVTAADQANGLFAEEASEAA